MLILLAVAGFSFGALGRMLRPDTPSPILQASRIILLPETLDGLPIARRWDNRRPSGALEQGAIYGATGHDAGVQLDFYRHSPVLHNGIACYLNQGEILLSERIQTVRFARSHQSVDLALTRSEDRLRLVAATECGPQTCDEHPLPLWHALWRGLRVRIGGAAPAANAAVPVSVVLTATLTSPRDASAIRASLLTRFRRVAAQIDLRPARRLAAVQSGNPVGLVRLRDQRLRADNDVSAAVRQDNGKTQ